MVVEKRVLMKVVFPKPDSPATYPVESVTTSAHRLQTRLTMIVKAAPLFATILCRWLGRLAMPMGEADSTGAGAIFDRGDGWFCQQDGKANVASTRDQTIVTGEVNDSAEEAGMKAEVSQ